MKFFSRNFWIIFYFESQKSALLVSWFQSFGKRYEIDLRVLFYHRPKLGLGLDVAAEIQILSHLLYAVRVFNSFLKLAFYSDKIAHLIILFMTWFNKIWIYEFFHEWFLNFF